MNENRGAHKRRSVHCYELNKTFSTIAEASIFTGIPATQISTTCQGRQKTAKGHTFCYVENKSEINLTKNKEIKLIVKYIATNLIRYLRMPEKLHVN